MGPTSPKATQLKVSKQAAHRFQGPKSNLQTILSLPDSGRLRFPLKIGQQWGGVVVSGRRRSNNVKGEPKLLRGPLENTCCTCCTLPCLAFHVLEGTESKRHLEKMLACLWPLVAPAPALWSGGSTESCASCRAVPC